MKKALLKFMLVFLFTCYTLSSVTVFASTTDASPTEANMEVGTTSFSGLPDKPDPKIGRD